MHRLLETAMSLKDENITLLDAVMEAARRLGIEPKRAGTIIKKDAEFLEALRTECEDQNMLRH